MIHREKSDLIIGFGGGSPSHRQSVSNHGHKRRTDNGIFWDRPYSKSGLPTIIIPTTAGTGSEVTPIVILSDHTEKLKKGIVSQHLFPPPRCLIRADPGIACPCDGRHRYGRPYSRSGVLHLQKCDNHIRYARPAGHAVNRQKHSNRPRRRQQSGKQSARADSERRGGDLSKCVVGK